MRIPAFRCVAATTALIFVTGLPAAPETAQKTFATPQAAAAALIAAAEAFDTDALVGLFGPEGEDLFSSADAVQDRNHAAEFAARARQKNAIKIDLKKPSRAKLIVGSGQWPFPVPIVRTAGKWAFSTPEGIREILVRRIGSNELDAIQVCRGFVEAQMDYAAMAREVTGVTQYAQRLISSPGKRDGLYWQNEDGSPGGPISEVVAKAIEEGYKASSGGAYHGYYFKVLKGQGPAAPLGEMDYVVKEVMIGGFALLAFPAEYRVTGVKTFIVSYDGIVYEKDLGPDTLNAAKAIERYNPDQTWRRTDDEWPPGSSDF